MLWFVVLLFPLFSLAKKSSKQLTAAEIIDDVTKPVNVSVYYQTLCPASQYLIQYPVWNLFKDLYENGIVDINLHAYGNAQETQENGNFKVTCQHGDLECKLNTVANCVKHLYKDKKPHGRDVEFVHCLLNDSSPTMVKAKDCAHSNGLHWDNIHGCSTGLLGYHLQHKEAAITPPHDQIPWVMVNGVGESQDQEDLRIHLEEIVCQEYKGDKPTPCTTAAEKKYLIPRDDC